MEFPDRLVTYDSFIADLADKVAERMLKITQDPEVISQRKAFEMFGRGNVERWRKKRLVEPSKRPGKIEYRTSELRQLQAIQQDYFA